MMTKTPTSTIFLGFPAYSLLIKSQFLQIPALSPGRLLQIHNYASHQAVFTAEYAVYQKHDARNRLGKHRAYCMFIL